MKKLLMFANKGRFSGILNKGTLFPALAVGLGLAFWAATAPVVNAQVASENAGLAAPAKHTPTPTPAPSSTPTKGKGKPGKGGPASGKCDVCHNPHNYHTISIPCDQVDKFLSNHPGDFRGRCEATPVANP
jgi:hypothetical protein